MRTKDETKSEAIFQATIQLLNEIGFAEISMSKIAKRAGVSPSTIYVYFDNKEDMINKLYINVKQKLSRSLLEGIEPAAPIRNIFERILKNLLNFALNFKNEFLFIEQFANSPLVRNEYISQCESMFAPLLRFVEQGISQKLIKDVNPNLILGFCYYPVVQLIKEYFMGNIEIDSRMFDSIVEMSWDAVKA